MTRISVTGCLVAEILCLGAVGIPHPCPGGWHPFALAAVKLTIRMYPPLVTDNVRVFSCDTGRLQTPLETCQFKYFAWYMDFFLFGVCNSP